MRASLKVFVLLAALAGWGMLWWSSEIEAQITSGTVNAKQSGTWTVQPGNTANSTAWLVTGTGGTFPIPANSAVNVAQINGVAPLMGNGVTGTGSLRVTIASDNTALSVNTTPVGLTSLVTGQQAVTATAAVLPTQASKIVCIKVLIAGTQDVYYGPTGVTTGTGFQLSAGDGKCFALDNVNRIFVIAAGTGSTVSWESQN